MIQKLRMLALIWWMGKKSKKRKAGSASGTNTGVKKAKKIKDPNAPKRPPTAFMIFSTEEKRKNDLGDDLSFGEKGEVPVCSVFIDILHFVTHSTDDGNLTFFWRGTLSA